MNCIKYGMILWIEQLKHYKGASLIKLKSDWNWKENWQTINYYGFNDWYYHKIILMNIFIILYCWKLQITFAFFI